MAFSWAQTKQDALKIKIRHATVLSGLNVIGAVGNKDYKALHGYKSKDEVKLRITEKVKKNWEIHDKRMAKLK